jgi:hypothetical protein
MFTRIVLTCTKGFRSAYGYDAAIGLFVNGQTFIIAIATDPAMPENVAFCIGFKYAPVFHGIVARGAYRDEATIGKPGEFVELLVFIRS